MYSLNVCFEEKRVQRQIYQRSQTMGGPSTAKLNQNSLSILNAGLDSSIVNTTTEDIDVISSGRDTEYSVSPQIYQK